MDKRVLVLVAVLALTATVAHADIFTSWAPSDLLISDPAFASYPSLGTDTDALVTGSRDGRDIYNGVYFKYDASYYYFRLALAGTPTPSTSDYALIYGLYIDVGPGGGPGTHEYVPDEYGGVDYILDFHTNSQGDPGQPIDIAAAHFHVWQGTFYNTVNLTLGTQADSEFGASNAFEWKVAGTDLPFQMCMQGAAFDNGSPNVSYDLTEKGCTPEPGTMALLGLGLPGLAWLKRRKTR